MKGLLAFALLGWAATAHADRYEITSRAASFSYEQLGPLLARGELALIEQEGDRIRQTVCFALVDAAPEKVFDLLMAVDEYPQFIRTIAEAEISARRGDQFAYRWKMDVPLISLDGHRIQRGKRPQLVEVRGLKGNFRQARERWELTAVDGGKRTLAAFYRTLDVETGGVVIETLAKLEPAFGAALSLASSFVHMRAVQRRAAGLPPDKPGPREGPVPPFTPLDPTNVAKLEPLLAFGNIVLVESHRDGGLSQVAMVARVDALRDRLVSILGAPDDYPKFIPNFAEQKSKPLPDGRLALQWELEVPFVNLTGTSVMTREADGTIDVLNTGGDIPRGRFRWEFLARGERTLPIQYMYSDVRRASFFTKLLVEKEPLFEHGAVIASAAVAMNGVKARAEGRR